ncbi:hypothetical protein [Streptomyces lydicus]|uniref:hypothetical protein n=1 Tax=Streptomyces lydicus TaxID=47763 RepID=UPI003788BFCF
MTDPATLAYQLAQQAHALNTATDKPQVFASVADVRDVAEGLQLTAEQMLHTLRHSSAGLRRIEEEVGVRMADGSDAGEGASKVLRALLNAEVGFTVARAALREAAVPLAGMSAGASDGAEIG